MLYHAWCGLVLCAKNLCVGLIKIYRNYLSPVKLSTCRFMPTCSAYMQEAIEKKGVCKGTAIGIKRILRCHPFGSNGYDPVNK
ncbi:MAG: membrane protein insertion efficiency factor YidD [Candidatus Omnitrophota bacterium]